MMADNNNNSNQPKKQPSVGAGGGGAGADDLQLDSLAPCEQLEQIQRMLNTHSSSDAVRQVLDDQKFRVGRISVYHESMAGLKATDLLDTPFFTIGGLKPANTRSSGIMSSDVTTTARKVLKKYYTYNVGFVQWEDFSEDVPFENLEDKAISPESVGCKAWAEVVVEFLTTSFDQKLEYPSESAELTLLGLTLNKVLGCFGFTFAKVAGSECDIEIFSAGDSAAGAPKAPFLFLEGKASSKLPLRSTDHPKPWADLCLFGFATKIARTKSDANEQGREALCKLLLGDTLRPDKLTTTMYPPSPMVKALLAVTSASPIGPVAQRVKTQLEAEKIESTDAVNLWAAVMQACHYSVSNRRNRSIVVSARMFWYIELETADKDDLELHWKCRVKISDAYAVGSQSFMRTLVAFLLYAEEQVLTNEHLREWQIALSSEHGGKRDTKPDPSNQNNQDPQQKRHKKSDQGGHSETSPAADGDERVIATSVSVDDDDDDEPMATDEYGVIPWFDQIDVTNAQVLGVGRAGKVTQVKWKGKDVALKTFSLQYNDERHLHDVYQHELDVLHSLRSLWGTHVPALLFHNPWATSPMIGLQLGGQLQDDMSKWSEHDYKSAMDTMKKVSDLGWEQEDVRGANFVRLTGSDGVVRIAMVDFESMVKTS